MGQSPNIFHANMNLSMEEPVTVSDNDQARLNEAAAQNALDLQYALE